MKTVNLVKAVLINNLENVLIINTYLKTERNFSAPGLRTNHFESFYLLFNKQ